MKCLTTTQVIAGKKVASGNRSGNVEWVTSYCVDEVYSELLIPRALESYYPQ